MPHLVWNIFVTSKICWQIVVQASEDSPGDEEEGNETWTRHPRTTVSVTETSEGNFFVFSYQNNVFSRKHLANKGRKCSWNISTFHWNPIVYTAKVRVKRTSYARPAGCSNVHRWNLQTYMCHFYKPSNLARSLLQCKVSTVILYYRRVFQLHFSLCS